MSLLGLGSEKVAMVPKSRSAKSGLGGRHSRVIAGIVCTYCVRHTVPLSTGRTGHGPAIWRDGDDREAMNHDGVIPGVILLLGKRQPIAPCNTSKRFDCHAFATIRKSRLRCDGAAGAKSGFRPGGFPSKPSAGWSHQVLPSNIVLGAS